MEVLLQEQVLLVKINPPLVASLAVVTHILLLIHHLCTVEEVCMVVVCTEEECTEEVCMEEECMVAACMAQEEVCSATHSRT